MRCWFYDDGDDNVVDHEDDDDGDDDFKTEQGEAVDRNNATISGTARGLEPWLRFLSVLLLLNCCFHVLSVLICSFLQLTSMQDVFISMYFTSSRRLLCKDLLSENFWTALNVTLPQCSMMSHTRKVHYTLYIVYCKRFKNSELYEIRFECDSSKVQCICDSIVVERFSGV